MKDAYQSFATVVYVDRKGWGYPGYTGVSRLFISTERSMTSFGERGDSKAMSVLIVQALEND